MFFYFLLCTSLSVEEDKYRQCEQSKFCFRNREVGRQYWKILYKSIEFHPDYFQAIIQDDKYDKQLLLYVYILHSSIRFRIEPTETESFTRYDTSKDRTIIMQNELNLTRKLSHGQNQSHVFLRYLDTTVTIQMSPFMATISNKRGKITTINPDDTAIFEHNRDRNKYPRLFDANDFNGFIDKIPNGPTAVAMDFFFHGDAVRLNGLPEHTLNLTLPFTIHKLRRRGEIEYQAISDPIRLFNVDINRYEVGNPMSMYGSIPFLMARDGSRTSGLFWANPSETWIDISEEKHGVSTRFLSEGGFIDFYVFCGGSSPNDVLRQYTQLTGRPHLPQSFALGFHMSRWGYKTSNEVREVIKKLDENMFPHDSIFLDLDHTDDRLYFTFHPHNFKDAQRLQDEIDPLERKLIALIDPHLRVDYGYPIFEKAFNSRYLIRTRIDSEYTGECWPGDSAWVDFVNPWARVWWETLFEFERYAGSTLTLYVWNDMNEPSVFNVPDGTCPKDVVHYKGIENREVHNVYGQLMISSTYGGLVKRDFEEDDRPFVLTRSFFAGSQKYAFAWTGDNTASWQQLRVSLPMILSLGLSGMPYVGADVGGFFDSPEQALLTRWYQVGAWLYPFFRCHSHHDTQRREPYLLRGGYQDAARLAIQERYMLSPYWYTLARHANLSGTPIVRPLFWEFPNDRRFADIEDKAMLGSSLLVLPVFEEFQREMIVDLPFCRWFDFRTLQEKTTKEGPTRIETPITTIPVLIRGGSIVPIKNWKRRTTYLMFRDPFTLIIALDEEGKASGDLYVDDGMTFKFGKKHFIHRRYNFGDNVLSSRPFNAQQEKGAFFEDYDVKIEKIQIAGLEKRPVMVRDANDKEFETEFVNGVLTIHRVNLFIKDNWAIGFEFEGELPPEIPIEGEEENEDEDEDEPGNVSESSAQAKENEPNKEQKKDEL
ncbi:glycosyl hydrolase [Tritrichomonas foetus]|uniref:Glucosidase II subunit alpha n=1 Tax=Tritrichomonas foetus TaxID=1144522 RepID=A0A1J4KLV8_9EUKA|nr:glycosyl hydrolase [Tritrichomonas foetus]|eukprot:OHT12203.1 glycosyl hydrolase [Tritrichomonas foetus]